MIRSLPWRFPGGDDSGDGRLVELGLAVHLDVRLAVVDEHSFCYLPLQGKFFIFANWNACALGQCKSISRQVIMNRSETINTSRQVLVERYTVK